jgi:hypothetical protein
MTPSPEFEEAYLATRCLLGCSADDALAAIQHPAGHTRQLAKQLQASERTARAQALAVTLGRVASGLDRWSWR